MKRFLPIFIFILTGLFLPTNVIAETTVDISGNGANVSTEVNVETSTGNNTICQNAKCETTSTGNGESKVCINGKCETNKDGNLNIQSEDGNTKINIQNSANNTPNTPNYPNNQNSESENNNKNQINVNTDSSNKTNKKVDDKKKLLKQKIDQEQKRMTKQANYLQKFLDNLKNMFKNYHLF